MANFPNPLRNLPSVSQLIESPPLKALVQTASHNSVVTGVRHFLEKMREQLASAAAASPIPIPSPSELAQRIADWLHQHESHRLRPVINATGVLLHTGLGRAPLAPAALDSIAAIAAGYSSLEVDLTSGERGHRADLVRALLCELTGAESATVVNNNAAATMLVLAAVAGGGEVLCSRGQLVEIGGSYRLPEVMQCSGARLREVGTTNKTRYADYEQAIGDQTKAILRVHPSNFRVVGFSESVGIDALVTLGRQSGLPVIDDIGSGALIDFSRFGLRDEPVISHSVAAGADLVLFSGDKLLGGPQCGIIVGKKTWVAQIERHPLARAMRVGKLTLAALDATLRLYRNPEDAQRQIPLLAMLSTSQDNLKFRAEKLAAQLRDNRYVAECLVEEGSAVLGGGSIPGQEFPSFHVAITPREIGVDEVAKRLRLGDPAVFGRIQAGRLILDLRSVQPKFDPQLTAAVQSATRPKEPVAGAGSPPPADVPLETPATAN